MLNLIELAFTVHYTEQPCNPGLTGTGTDPN